MAQEQIQYTIASDGTNPGSSVNVVFTYDANAVNADGSFTVTNASGTYSVLNTNGGVTRTDTITGIQAPNGLGGNDNHLFIGTQPYVNNNGVNFTISNAADSNDGDGNVNFFTFQDANGVTRYTESNNNDSSTTTVTQSAVCFTTGTRIRTARGEVSVEDLAVGDLAVTASGALRPIVWIGHRDIDGNTKALPHDLQPVRIRQGAFGHGLPARDLSLSPGHPVLVGADANNEGGVLVPVMCLVNGTSITREPATSVTYWHVELDAHDILLAEGLPAESYLDWGDRPFFTEASDHALHNPDFVAPGLSARCRPVAVDGAVVEAERVRLDAVFAAELATQGAWNDADAWLAA